MSADRLSAANKARRERHHTKSFTFGGRRGNSPAVRRHSQHAGEFELREWKRNNVFSASTRRARMRAITEWNYRSKEAGKPWGPLGPSGERFIDAMMGLRCFRTGRLDWSIKTLATKLRMCVQTVVSYIARCEALGLLVKLRRSAPIQDPEPGGPNVEQITNAYWFRLPADLSERVRQILSANGKPADQEDHERAQAAALQAMLDSLSGEELASFRLGDSSVLAMAMASFARAHDRDRGRF